MCHTKQILTVLVLLIIVIQPIKAAEPDLEELFIKSIGGPEAYKDLKEYTGYSATGLISMNGMQGRFQVDFKKPDYYKLVLKFGPMSLAQGYDGTIAWSTDMNGKSTVLQGMEKQDIMRNLYFETYAYLLDPDKINTYNYVHDTTENGTTYHVINFYPYENDTVVCWYNSKTGLREKQIGSMDMLTVVTEISAYKKIGHFLFPLESKTIMAAANSTIESKIDSVSFEPEFPADHFAMPGLQPEDFHFPDGQSEVTIPMDYKSGHIVLTIAINGKQYSVILDSGASTNIFHLPLMEEHQFTSVGSLPAMGVSGFDEITLYKTDSINIGALTLYGLVAGAMDLSNVFKAFTVQQDNFGGILGYDFLARYPVLIDYQDETITIFNPDNFTPDSGGVTLDFYQTMLVPTITAAINGVHGEFVVDLGNSFGVILNPGFVEKNKIEQSLTDIKENKAAIGGVGGQLAGKNGVAQTFTMGSNGEVQIDGLRVLMPESSTGMTGLNRIAGNIGNLILNQFNVLLDYNRNKIILYPNES